MLGVLMADFLSLFLKSAFKKSIYLHSDIQLRYLTVEQFLKTIKYKYLSTFLRILFFTLQQSFFMF